MNQETLKAGRFSFEMDWPEAILGELQPLIEQYDFLIPSWCNVVRVLWCPKMDKFYATMDAEISYRRATLSVSPSLMDHDDAARQKTIRHELIHISTVPLVEFAERAIKTLTAGDDKRDIRKALNRELKHYHEGMTEDLAHCLEKK